MYKYMFVALLILLIRPTDCVTAEKYKAFREDLVQQTIAVLGSQVSIPSEIYDQLGISSDSGFPK